MNPLSLIPSPADISEEHLHCSCNYMDDVYVIETIEDGDKYKKFRFYRDQDTFLTDLYQLKQTHVRSKTNPDLHRNP